MQQHEIDETDVGAQHGIFFGTGGNTGLWRRLLRFTWFMRFSGRLLRRLTGNVRDGAWNM